jgi:hypothetical protein
LSRNKKKKKLSSLLFINAAAGSYNSTPPATCQPGQDGTTQFGIQQPRFAKGVTKEREIYLQGTGGGGDRAKGQGGRGEVGTSRR